MKTGSHGNGNKKKTSPISAKKETGSHKYVTRRNKSRKQDESDKICFVSYVFPEDSPNKLLINIICLYIPINIEDRTNLLINLYVW
jgi:hypothetical protein